MRLLTIAALGLLVSSSVGCAGTKYGSHPYHVTLETDPPGCEAWIVPNTAWVDEKDELLSGDGKALKDYDSGVTPWVIYQPPYLFVFVAKYKGELRYKSFKPSLDETVRIAFTAPAEMPAGAPKP